MNRRKFLQASGAALAAWAINYSRGRTQSISPASPNTLYFPVVANKAQMSGSPFLQAPLPYAVDFLASPDGALPAALYAPTWIVQNGAANNYPALASQLNPNGSMESGSPPSGYYIYGNVTATRYAAERTGGVGSYSQALTIDAGGTSGGSVITTPIPTNAGDWFHVEAWLKSSASGLALTPVINTANSSASLAVGAAYSGSAWANQVLTAQNTNVGISETIQVSGAGGQFGLVDDFFVYKLAPRDLFATLKGAANYCCSVRADTLSNSRQFGLVLNCDAPSSPKNYLLVWYDRLNGCVWVDEYVNGVMTNKLRAADGYNFAYLSLTAVKQGSNLDVYWAGTKLNATPIPVSAAVASNPYLGFMSPYQGRVIKFSAAPAPVQKNILYFGDSKFVRNTPGIPPNVTGMALIAVESPTRIAVSGQSTWGAYLAIKNNSLDAATGTPDFIFYNLGANDDAQIDYGDVTEADWKTYTNGILQALHTKWLNARVFLARAWIRRAYWPYINKYNETVQYLETGGMDDANRRVTWLEEVLSDPYYAGWAFLGPDERVFLENGDDGYSMTVDGVHPNALGEYRSAQEWRRCAGYE